MVELCSSGMLTIIILIIPTNRKNKKKSQNIFAFLKRLIHVDKNHCTFHIQKDKRANVILVAAYNMRAQLLNIIQECYSPMVRENKAVYLV